MKLLFSFTIYFTLIFFTHISCSDDLFLPYQDNCNKNNLTNSILNRQTTEAGFCPECETENLYQTGITHTAEALRYYSIPKACFLAIALKGNQIFNDTQYKSCNGNTKLCINEEYINMIYNSFVYMSKCFDLNAEKQAQLFHLISHESSGILNANSRTTAQCLGQVTKVYVDDINTRLNTQSSMNVFTRCLGLEDKVRQNNQLSCKFNEDPDICLFYTFTGFERNRSKVNNTLNPESPLNNDQKEALSRIQTALSRIQTDEETDLSRLIPIKINEILYLQVSVNNQTQNWIISDDTELYNRLKSYENIEIRSANKIPLFKDQERFELFTSYWAYNGGISLAGNRLKHMVERLKRRLSSPVDCHQECSNYTVRSEKVRCRLNCISISGLITGMIEKIKSGESLSASDYFPFFENDILYHYPAKGFTRRNEVSKFVRNIGHTNLETYSQSRNTMVGYFKNLATRASPAQINDFYEHISRECPKTNFNLPPSVPPPPLAQTFLLKPKIY